MHAPVLIYINQHTKFKVSSFTNSKDMSGAKLKKIGLSDPDHAYQGAVCHFKANTCCIVPAYKIWRLSLRPFRRYDCKCQKWKWITWPWPRPLWRSFVIFTLGLNISYLCTKFEHSSFSRSRDIVGAHQNSNGSRDLTTPLTAMVCHPRARNCYA